MTNSKNPHIMLCKSADADRPWKILIWQYQGDKYMTRATDIAGAFVDAWNRHDMNALAGLFADDADFVNVVGMWWKNREEIFQAHQFSHGNMFKDSRLEAKATSLKLLRPGVASLHMTWELVGMKGMDGSPVPPRTGILVFIATEDNGRWTVRTAQNTDIVPAR